jgi:hypothetical protein
MTDLLDKKSVLNELVHNLSLLIEMLKLEPGPNHRYAPFFEYYLEQARQLAEQEFTFEELKELSISLEGLFNPTFLDYSPAVFDPATGRFTPVKGTENYYEVQSKVSQLTLELRTLGVY